MDDFLKKIIIIIFIIINVPLIRNYLSFLFGFSNNSIIKIIFYFSIIISLLACLYLYKIIKKHKNNNPLNKIIFFGIFIQYNVPIIFLISEYKKFTEIFPSVVSSYHILILILFIILLNAFILISYKYFNKNN